MLRLKKLRTQRDPTSASATKFVAQWTSERHRRSVGTLTHGRTQTPAEVALRLLILKHVRNWSYDTLEREVRANLVYRAFTRIGDERVPDAKTLARTSRYTSKCIEWLF